MQFSLHRWIRLSLFNLMLVAALGVVLRYKIAFYLPFIDQKNLHHGHSHFAFAGWITQAIFVLLVGYLAARTSPAILKKYQWMLLANLITAYGMLIAFAIEGYGSIAIIFSTLSVFVAYAFSIKFWFDLNKLPTKEVSHLWLKAALLFNAISTLGVFGLAAMMVTKNVYQKWYLAAEYFYLHFQYNGWFFFACVGLFTGKLTLTVFPQVVLKKIFWLFTASLIPAYFLSVLWINFSLVIYLIIVVAAFVQLLSWVWLVRLLKTQVAFLKQTFSLTARWLFGLSAIALSIKLLLQLFSVIPTLSNISYGFRPIIIGYLHLVLLCVISLFILGFMVAEKFITLKKTTLTGLIVFTSGIIINEILLMVQGVTAMSYNTIPFINEALFITALIIFSGLVMVTINQQIKKQ